ncbi:MULTISPECIES: 5-methyltetrahydropteroyltriglutamate--homocysteine methyltransferase [unclassified Pseudomonas]|uniref:5-methyltetrahydropteroyltriglutamate-- homocysteine methyltransferase n=1 Tax=unclassified Pseudomonas TaxID=196821 RepID=UPI0004882292|nr:MULTISPECIES: 5-methyltetrahydropteroyltriglutamate--homocysteine methyltransferase [unclassified Pseudomonas]RAS23351.1 5-methyltetrahydropteroyltriglutamate--homocysteine methyltransferase [Pseudomonas sp. URMO17WK12:I7]SMF52257.1 5-methyltetrahydropteroyltriglutamate--homocysteine methyltransferase [Pseudomonas sp. URMO17WK12:I5]
MALAHNLGFPRINRDRELRARHWQMQKDAGIELLPVGDSAWYDQVPPHSLSTDDQQFAQHWEQLFEEVKEAKALGHAVKPVVIGPLTYLWLGKKSGSGLDELELLERLLPLYDQALNRLAGLGVEWVQIDEPILAQELPQDWKSAYERVYNILQRAPLKKLIAIYSGGLEGNLGVAANLPVDGLHIDLVQAPDQYPTILDRLPAYKVLSLGLVDGNNASSCDLEKTLDLLRDAHDRLGERLWVAASCSLLHSPVDQAVQKCQEVALLASAINQAAAYELRATA